MDLADRLAMMDNPDEVRLVLRPVLKAVFYEGAAMAYKDWPERVGDVDGMWDNSQAAKQLQTASERATPSMFDEGT
jgi:hypothetical protein